MREGISVGYDQEQGMMSADYGIVQKGGNTGRCSWAAGCPGRVITVTTMTLTEITGLKITSFY
jgi:hypothetical protein